MRRSGACGKNITDAEGGRRVTDQTFVQRTPGLFSSLRVDWRTPKGLFDALNAEFNFTLDVCAVPNNAMLPNYLPQSADSLSLPWEGSCFLNPPYGKEIGKWIEKAHLEATEGRATVVCLLPSRTDTLWFHDHCLLAEIRFLRGRSAFSNGNKRMHRAPFPSMVVIFSGPGGSK
jgi:phage N-6-adenine-methyltransferase